MATVVKNIHFGLSAWQTNRAYNTGNRVSNSGNAYQCIVSGLSAVSGSGPTGTTGIIADNQVIWKYITAIDYTSAQAHWNALPSPAPDDYFGILWNDAVYTTSPGVAFLTASGKTITGSVTYTPAAGESVADRLSTNTIPLLANSTYGFCFLAPNSVGEIGTNYFDITATNVKFDGIQIIDPLSSSNCTLINVNAGSSGFELRNSILDGFSQSNGGYIVFINDSSLITNSLFVDRDATNAYSFIIGSGAAATPYYNFVNCGFVWTNNKVLGGGITINTGTANNIIRNCYTVGHPTPVGLGIAINGGTFTADHCSFTANNAFMTQYGITDGGNNIFNMVATNQFYNSKTDLRLQPTSSLINSAVSDTLHIPTSRDIANTSRPQLVSWDRGPWEYRLPPLRVLNIPSIMFKIFTQ